MHRTRTRLALVIGIGGLLLTQTSGKPAFHHRSGSSLFSDDPPPLTPVSGDRMRPPLRPAEGGGPERPPFAAISPSRMLSALRELTAIGKSNLFRTSGSEGEREAFSWLAAQLSQLSSLGARGAALERPGFRIPLATEVRESRLSLTVAGQEHDVAAHALQGNREDLALALRYDSDGQPNDTLPNPVSASGPIRFLQRMTEVHALAAGSLRGTVAFVDYALVDRGILTVTTATQNATALLRAEPAALILVTRFSNTPGVSHGSFAGDVSIFTGIQAPPSVPTLIVRIEDLASAGIQTFADLPRITRAQVSWDADISSPGNSEYLAYRIPGRDSSRALILGAHLDSPNSPGALDDGSGAVTLLEMARILDECRIRPPVDIFVVWFGSHERGLYGSAAFTQSHSEVLDRAIAMLQFDCLTHPLDGMQAGLVLESQSYAGLGNSALPFPETLQRLAASHGVPLWVADVQGVASDNSSFAGFGIPNADTIYLSEIMTEVHVQGHLHDPYDDMPLAELHENELAQMAAVALTAALDLPLETAPLRVTPDPVSRAVFVASHTEPVQMTPPHLSMLGMTLTWEGWDVDSIPYGSPVTQASLNGAGLVIVLPVVDYPSALGGTEPYDEAFFPEEADVLRRYVENGGFLVLTNSASRLRYGMTPLEPNEDSSDINTVGSLFGMTFSSRTLTGTQALAYGSHPLMAGVRALGLVAGNGLAIEAPRDAAVLAFDGGNAAAAISTYGNGEVLALADASILGGKTPDAPNRVFWTNLARYARARKGL